MSIVNLTPHDISFVVGDDVRIIPPSGDLARVDSKVVTIGDFDGIPITVTKYSSVVGLPDRKPGTIYLVSSLVASRVPDRDDVFVPSDSIRDDKGRIVGAKSLGRITP